MCLPELCLYPWCHLLTATCDTDCTPENPEPQAAAPLPGHWEPLPPPVWGVSLQGSVTSLCDWELLEKRPIPWLPWVITLLCSQEVFNQHPSN